MMLKKTAAMILVIVLAVSLSAYALATDAATVTVETTTTTETTGTSNPNNTVTEGDYSGQGTIILPPSYIEDNGDDTGTEPTPTPTEAPTTDGTGLEPDKYDIKITKHPGDERNKQIGTSVYFTAGCTNYSDVIWHAIAPTGGDFIATDMINHIGGVSAVVQDEGGGMSRLTVFDLNADCNGLKVYAEFTTPNGLVQTNAATITVAGAAPRTPAPTAEPTPAPTPAVTPAPAATPAPAMTVAPVQTAAPAPVMTTQDPAALAQITPVPAEETVDRDIDKGPSWAAPGAGISVFAMAAVAVAAAVVMILYDVGVIKLSGLERAVTKRSGGKSGSDED